MKDKALCENIRIGDHLNTILNTGDDEEGFNDKFAAKDPADLFGGHPTKKSVGRPASTGKFTNYLHQHRNDNGLPIPKPLPEGGFNSSGRGQDNLNNPSGLSDGED